MRRSRRNKVGVRSQVERIALALEALESRIMLSTPTIQYISDSPDPVGQGGALTLAAHRVVDTDDAVASVRFYRSTDTVFNAGSDPLIGLATQSPSNPAEWAWTGTANWAAGVWYYFGVARDAAGNNSVAALTSGTVDVPPAISSLTGTPTAVSPGDSLKLTANGVTDADGSIVRVDFYHDANNSGVWDPGDTLLGSDMDGSDGWSTTTLVQWTRGDYFARATDNAGLRSPFVKGHVDQKPVITAVSNNPNPIQQGGFVTFTATGVSDSDGTVTQVAFYIDTFDTGHFDPGFDQFVGNGTNMGGGTWALTVLATWDPTLSPMYFAVPKDNEGFLGNAVWTLNQNPTIDAVSADQNPVPLGTNVNLIASGVQDSDGYIRNVQFSVDAPTAWWPYSNTPTAEHQDSNGVDNWTWDNVPVDWTITDMQQADFNKDGFADLAVTVNVASTSGSDFVSILLNDGHGGFLTVSTLDLFQRGRPNYNPTSLTVGDFNNDSYPDIATANSGTDYVSVMLNDGTGHFNSYTDYSADFKPLVRPGLAVFPSLIVSGDYNADGNIDLFAPSSVGVSNGEASLLLGDGTGAFTINRIYSYGTSMWIDGTTRLHFAGTTLPQTPRGLTDALSTDIDNNPDFNNGADIGTVGPNGTWFQYNWLMQDMTDKNNDYFAPGNVIGRAFETGITSGNYQNAEFGFAFRTGNVWDWGLGESSRTDDWHDLWIHDGAVQMFHVQANEGQVITLNTYRVPRPDGSVQPLFAYLYDANGNAIQSVNFAAGVGVDLNATLDVGIWNAPATGDYFIAIAGQQILTSSDYVDPFTGYWVGADNLPTGGSDIEYRAAFKLSERATFAAALDTPISGAPANGMAGIHGNVYYFDANSNKAWDSGEPVWAETNNDGGRYNGGDTTIYGSPVAGEQGIQDNVLFNDANADLVWTAGEAVWAVGFADPRLMKPVGSGTSLTAADFMDDDYNNNVGGLGPTSAEKDMDIATSDPTTNEVNVLLNHRWVGPKSRDAYGGFFDYQGRNAVYSLGTHTPTSITAANIDSDLNNNASSDPYWDWAQGSTGPHVDEQYNDLVTTNADGSLSILVNTAEHSGNFAVHEYTGPGAYDPRFDNAAINFNVENNAFGGPFQSPVGVLVGDYTGNGLQSFAVAEKYNIGILRQAYPFNSSDPLDLHQYPGEVPQVGLPFDFAGRYSVVLPQTWQRNVTYYATAFDDDYSPPLGQFPDLGPPYNPQYQGYSNVVSTDVALNQPPVIWSLTPDRQTLSNGDTLTLTANGVQDLDGFVAGVQFYRYRGSGSLDPSQDTLIGTDVNGFDGWSWTGTVSDTGNTFYARAIDSDNAVGALVATHVNIVPTVAAVYANGVYDTAYDQLITGAAPGGSLGIRGNVVFYDANANSRWDTGEAIWADNGNGNVYNGTQTHIFDGTDPWTSLVGKKGVVGNLLFRDANANGVWDSGEGVWAEGILQGQTFVLTAVDVSPGAGSTADNNGIRKVEFFRDSNYNGVFDPGVDYFMGRGYDIGAGRGTATHDWRLEVGPDNNLSIPVVDWASGSQTYFAVVQDFNDDWSVASSAKDYVTDLPPHITSLTTSPEPVTKGTLLTLTANGVFDQYGQVRSVSFYLDANGDNLIDPNVDTLLGIDQSGADGWSLALPVTWGSVGNQQFTYMARVTDDSGSTADAARVGHVNLPPVIDHMTTSPDPVDQMSQITLTAFGVTDPDVDGINKVEFYRDSNGNGVLDPGVDQLLYQPLVQNLGGGTWRWQGTANWSLGDQIYFSRALDNQGGWSQPVTVRGVVANPPPVITSLVSIPEPVTQGYTLELIAKGVSDANGNVVKVELYRDLNGNGDLDPAADQLLGTVTSPIGQDYAFSAVVDWESGSQIYFARALDNNGAWSTVASVQGHVNGRPVVASLTADPNPLTPGDTLTLTATGVSDPDGTVQHVAFYRDTNGDGVFEESSDALIGTDTDGADGWSLAFTDSTGIKTFFARALDNSGGWSFPASVNVGRRPAVGGLVATPDPSYPGLNLHLTATNVSDIDGTVDSVLFFLDSNKDGVPDSGSDRLLGVDTTPGDGWSLAINPTWGGGQWTYFAIARDNDANFTLDAKAAKTSSYVDFLPTIASLTALPNPVTSGDNLTLSVTGADDSQDVSPPSPSPGSVKEADFYLDTNGNGVLDPSVDTLIGLGTDMGGGVWSLIASTAGWNTGTQTFFARVRDNVGAWSDPLTTTARVDARPVIGGLISSPEPVIRGGNLTLTASNVTDPDGTVTAVNFYRDANANGVLDLGVDTLIGTGTASATTWTLTASTTGWSPIGDQTYFAQAVDNDGSLSAAASVHGTLITVPAVQVVMQAASDTGVSQTDRITSDTTPTYDVTVNDAGTIRIDWDGDTVWDVTSVVGAAGTYAYTPSPLADGNYPVDVSFTDTGPNTTTTSAPTTIDTVAPAKPAAPDLQAASDNGLSNTDNVTSITSPWFDVASTDTYFRFYRNGTKISSDYEPGTTYHAISQPLGTWDYSVRSFDAAGNSSPMSDSLAVTFVSAAPAPVAPDLQAASDTGISNTDNITNAVSPVFNVVPTDTFFRFYRSGVLISGTESGTTFTALSEPEGTWNYTVTSISAGGAESLQSPPLTVTIDRTAPTVTDGRINVVFSVDGGRTGIADFGDVLRVTWNNSGTGDANTDVVSVAADMTQFAGPAALTMYDDATHGDVTAGDGIWTALYTIGPGTATPLANASVMATDRAGNVGTGHDTSDIPFVVKALATRQFGGVLVSLWDMWGNSGFDPANFIVTPGSNNAISSIKLAGTGSGQGIGITISGATSVGTISDGRKGLVIGDLSFIASNAPIKGITLKSGMTGMRLDGMSLGGLTFPTDLDGDGEPADLTAIYDTGAVQTVLTARGVSGDVIVKGANSSGVSLSSFTTTTGGFHGDMIMPGSAGKITLGGALSSEINVGGALSSLSIKGNMNAGSHVKVGGTLGTLKVTGSLVGGATEDQMVQILARNITSVQITGNVTDSRILAGADLGDDWALGGTGDDADTFLAGSIGSISIGGSVSDSLIGAGLVSHDDTFDLSWLKANSAFIAGSVISKITIAGTLTSSVPLGPFGIGAYDIGSYTIGGLTIHPLVVSQI